jgi:predicted alpha/beta superfamily hydrolase
MLNYYKIIRKTIWIAIFVSSQTLLQGQITIVLDSVPTNTPQTYSIFIAGSFNGWDPGNADYKLEMNEALNWFQITLPSPEVQYEYKFTRGSWATVETDALGNEIENRSISVGGADSIFTRIDGWEDLIEEHRESTAASNVHLLSDSFYIPQLDVYRRIIVCLPPDYHVSNRRYPVLYMQDGQNIFDASTSYAGEWEVDETLNDLHAKGDPGIIVVAIDHGQQLRIEEYSPWMHEEHGGGKGIKYAAFLAQTLKPFIDSCYRTLPGRKFTGIMGSSLGGLISLYAGIEYSNVFGKIGVFSPSYWFSSKCFDHVAKTEKNNVQFIYQVISLPEGENHAADVTKMDSILHSAGFETFEIKTRILKHGAHSEWFWASVFADAYQWLFSKNVPGYKCH